jgi:DNA-binding PadR family transcriptional regulator
VNPALTTTSYAILGLLAIKPWTTYELTQQMERSFRNFWPRAESRIYEEPKRLVRRGLARASADAVGHRPRTVYSITAAGRRALVRWLDEPSQGPSLECEALVKVFFAEMGSRTATTDRINDLRRWAHGKQAEHIAVARNILDSGGPFPQRLPQLVLVGRFLRDFADLVDAWADWAEGIVAGWPDSSEDREPDWPTLDEMAARAVPGAPRSPRGRSGSGEAGPEVDE